MPTTRKERYDKALDQLAALLKGRKKPITAAELAKRLRCTRATVYNRLSALAKRGVRIAWTELRDGRRGPLSTAFTLP